MRVTTFVEDLVEKMKSLNWLLFLSIAGSGACLAEDAPESDAFDADRAANAASRNDAIERFNESAPTVGSSYSFTQEVVDLNDELVEDMITVELVEAQQAGQEMQLGDQQADDRTAYLARYITWRALSGAPTKERTATASGCYSYPNYTARKTAQDNANQALANDIACWDRAILVPSTCRAYNSVPASSVPLPHAGTQALPSPASVILGSRTWSGTTHSRGPQTSCGNWYGSRWRPYVSTVTVKAECGGRCG